MVVTAEKRLSQYPNTYADLSAGSGYNAITRDPEFGYHFLEKFLKLLIEKIGKDNLKRILRL